jgi:lipopolysaccharide/colanic/teichoic acid biosynthesis glycosyltransferase
MNGVIELEVKDLDQRIVAFTATDRAMPPLLECIRLQRVAAPHRSPYGRLARATKRAIDLGEAALVLIILLPLFLVISVAIWLESPGPILFRQRRLGLGGRSFEILKFRTMVCDAEERLAQLETMNESPDGLLFQVRNDPRITRVGRFLRRTSLDELPQLINVLRGEMSLVGPRPLQLRDCRRLAELDPPLFGRRFSVPPGLTGLAQVSGRRDLDPRRMLELDQRYVESWSLAGDLAILGRTMSAVISGRGAL